MESKSTDTKLHTEDSLALLEKTDQTSTPAVNRSGLSRFFKRKPKLPKTAEPEEPKLEETAMSYENTAYLLYDQSKYLGAGILFEKAAKIRHCFGERNYCAYLYIKAFDAYDNANDISSASFTLESAMSEYQLGGSHVKETVNMYVRRLDVNTAKLKLYLVATKRMRYTGLQKFCEIFENTAHLLAVEQLYLRAVVMFEDMITSLSKYAPADLKPTLALCAGICSLCSAVNDPTLDLTDTKNKLLEYRRRKWLLPEDPELILILNLVDTVENNQPTLFTQHMDIFNKFRHLNSWEKEMLLRIRNTLDPEYDPELESVWWYSGTEPGEVD